MWLFSMLWKNESLALPKWVRKALYLIVLVISSSSMIQLWFVHEAEELRKSDVTLLSLAAAQSTLSQRMIRFAMAFQREKTEDELRTSVSELTVQGERLDALLQKELNSPRGDLAGRHQNIREALEVWQGRHRALIAEGGTMVANMQAGDMDSMGMLSSSVQITADNNLSASNRLYAEIDDLVNNRSNKALSTINNWILINLIVMLVLSPILVEPIIALIKRQYQQLLEQSTELELAAQEREKVATAAWIKAEATSRTALEEKLMFIAIGSHDLRTPLQTILSTVDLMTIRAVGVDLDPMLDESLSKLRIACRHVEGIARDLGEFVRDSEGYGREATRAIHLSQLLLDNHDLYYELTVAKGISLTLQENHLHDYIEIEENSLRRILSNLVSNAIKYTRDGGVKITSRNLDDQTLEIRVEDTGIGIPDDQLAQIAKPFYRGAAGRSATKDGLGLGLSIVDRFVSFMGGRLVVESAPGQGSAFTVQLPFKRLLDERGALSRESTAEALQIDFASTVLFVDDERGLVQELSTATDALGPAVVAVGHTDTQQALAFLAGNDVDCIFIDLQMAPMDGYQFAQAARALPLKNRPRLIAMSAYIMEPEKRELFDQFVSKPIALRLIASILKDFRRPQAMVAETA